MQFFLVLFTYTSYEVVKVVKVYFHYYQINFCFGQYFCHVRGKYLSKTTNHFKYNSSIPPIEQDFGRMGKGYSIDS